MDFSQIITVFAIIATNLGTVIALYCQSDRKIEENRRELITNLEENRKELLTKLEENRKETNTILAGIQQEIKDFHGRLCAIEERRRNNIS